MSVLHTGSTKKFSANWQNVFGKGKKSSAKASTQRKPSTKAKRGTRKAGK